MKLRNKKTGEIGYFCFANWNDPVLIITDENGIQLAKYNSLAELNAEWKDVSEDSGYWYYDTFNKNIDFEFYPTNTDDEKADREIGNHFSTREEGEKAVEKLKAFKRLKDKGFRFERWLLGGEYGNTITFSDYIEYDDETRADLNLLFWR